MNTETLAVTTPAITQEVDLDTRLTLASAGMDATLTHKHGEALAEAETAVQLALFEVADLPAVEPQFQPNPVLKAAGDLIRTRGWVKGKSVTPDGAVCASYAIELAAPGADATGNGRMELLNRIAAEFGEALSIPMWNDRQTDVKDVLRLMY